MHVKKIFSLAVFFRLSAGLQSDQVCHNDIMGIWIEPDFLDADYGQYSDHLPVIGYVHIFPPGSNKDYWTYPGCVNY